MRESIAHRGPDSYGQQLWGSIGLAHQRLSIIDIDSGSQPISYRGYSIVYNGELYNHKEIRKELEQLGHALESDCDTDVFLAAYTEWGVNSFKRFNGMFAAIIYDHGKDEMIAVRDRFGIKPLYVGDGPHGVRLFASEQQAISEYDKSYKWDLNLQALDNYLSLGYIIEPMTIKMGIRQVKPGTYEVHSLSRGDKHERFLFWSLADAMNAEDRSISKQEGSSLLSKAVSSQTVADVPVGTFLSGGLDSSLLTSIAKSQSPLGEIHSFSAGFNESGYDEIPIAKGLAKKLGINHHFKYFDSGLLKEIPLLMNIYGGPFADNAALPTYHLSKNASEHVKVLLSGDGADELFFGYRNHRSLFAETAIKGVLPEFVKKPILKWVSDWYPNHPKMPRALRAKSTLRALSQDLAEGYCSAMSTTSREMLDKIYSTSTRLKIEGGVTENKFSEIASEFTHDDPMKVMQYIDFQTYLPGSVLTKVDRATMRAGIEARVPFLDNELSAAALCQNSNKNLGWGSHKTQLRNWSKNWLSSDTSTRVKRSFTSPLDEWFRALQYHDFCRIIMSENLRDSGLFDIDNLQLIMDNHYSGKANYGPTLWSIAILSKAIQ